MTITFNCTGCDRGLEVDDAKAGRQVRCGGCGAVLTVPGRGRRASRDEPPPLPPRTGRPRPAAESEDDWPDEPVRLRRQPARRRPGGKRGWLVGGLVGGLVLLAVGGGLAWYFFFNRTGLGDDLQYLPDNCHVIQSSRIDQILASSVYQDLEMERRRSPGEPDDPTELELGLPLKNIARVTLGAREGDNYVLVVTTKRPVRAEDLLDAMKQHSYSETKVGRFTVFEEAPHGFAVVDRKTVVYGPSATLRQVLQRDRPAELPEGMRAALKEVDFSQSVVTVRDMKAIRGRDPFLTPAPDRFGGIQRFLDPSRNQTASVELYPFAAHLEATGVDYHAQQITVKSAVTRSDTFYCQDPRAAAAFKAEIDKSLSQARTAYGTPPPEHELMGPPKVSASGSTVTFDVRFKVHARRRYDGYDH